MEAYLKVAAETFLERIEEKSWSVVRERFDKKNPLYIYDSSEAHHKLLAECADAIVDIATKRLWGDEK